MSTKERLLGISLLKMMRLRYEANVELRKVVLIHNLIQRTGAPQSAASEHEEEEHQAPPTPWTSPLLPYESSESSGDFLSGQFDIRRVFGWGTFDDRFFFRLHFGTALAAAGGDHGVHMDREHEAMGPPPPEPMDVDAEEGSATIDTPDATTDP